MLQRRTLLKSLPLAAAGIAGGAALSSCGSSSSGSGGAGDDGSLTWMSIVHTPVTPEPTGPVETTLRERTGVDISFQWVPDASKDEKITSALASGTIADITTLNQLAMPSIREPLASGLFWEVGERLADYANLSRINPTVIAGARVDGGLYGVPFQSDLARYGVIIRKDWLDRLGLEVPHTVEALGEVARAFTEGDPTGTGAATTGFIDRNESHDWMMRMFAGYFGAGCEFELDPSGKVVPTVTTDAYKEALAWYRDAYANGWVNQEFVTMQKENQAQAVAQDAGGIVVTGLFGGVGYSRTAKEINPDTEVEWALVNDMTYGDIPRRIVSDTGGGMGGLMAFSTQSLPTEEDLHRALSFIDALMEPENHRLLNQGVEGVHYEVDADGAATIVDETRFAQEVQPYTGSTPTNDDTEKYPSTDEMVNLYNELIAENSEYAVTNVAQPLTSATYDAQWGSISQAIKDAYNMLIVGQIDMAGYESVLEQQRGRGMDDIIAEYTEAYEAVN
ncbi:extracellular solute-binding protein [Brachybacterium phenoliresistens]|uniref:extracellular solute-binding protein n=1 Tax=Brachybacterium phenoliresistens TaxID=396014 RepID=UPI0031DBEDE9